MPSASNKLEKQASLEVGEPFKQALSVIEKKTRNLEKRKARLDLLKTQATELHDQQKEALNRYDEVVNTLEFSRDLAKQLTQISLDAIKAQKKHAKRELIELQARETSKLKEVLMINNVLSTMGDEKIRDDFLNGKDGAMTLSEESLQRLDALYKMITPTRDVEGDGPSYDSQLVSGSEHLFAIVEGKKKEILGTTYQALKELIFGIHDCAYFKKPEEKEKETTASVNGDHSGSETEAAAVVVEPEEKSTEQPSVVTSTDDETVEVQTENSVQEDRSIQAEDNSVFSTFTHTKPYGDVFPDAQGSFDFLQESQIDPDSPHMDPAVVAAHPMVPPSNRQQVYPSPSQPNELVSSPYPNQSVNDSQQVISSSTITIPNNQPNPAHFLQAVTPLPAGHLPDFSQITTQTYTNQHYVALPAFTAPIYSPIPPQAVTQNNTIVPNDESNWINDNKKHYMNVNATAFESRSFDSGEDNGAIRDDSNANGDHQTQPSENQNKYSSVDSQGYQSGSKGNFQSRSGYNNYRGNGGGRGGSSGGRGGPRGGSGGPVNSGNNGRGNRQGGGGYANNNSARGSGGGSGNYQGYRDGGYNNYQRENYNGSGGYGNNGGPRRGSANSNQRGNRGELNSRGGSRGTSAKTS